MSRPQFNTIKSGKEFNSWYWLKSEMINICKHLSISSAGSKFELRDRIMFTLDNPGKTPPKIYKKPKSNKKYPHIIWSKDTLTMQTIITPSITFGPNVRNFFTSQIGSSFSFSITFMEWIKSHSGKTLQDAVNKWYEIEKDKKNGFKQTIKPHNMYNQYVRDFFDDNPDATQKQARESWLKARSQKMENGFVRYKKSV